MLTSSVNVIIQLLILHACRMLLLFIYTLLSILSIYNNRRIHYYQSYPYIVIEGYTNRSKLHNKKRIY